MDSGCIVNAYIAFGNAPLPINRKSDNVGVRGRGTQSSAERHFVSKGSPARPCVSVLDRSCRSPVSVRNAQGWAENSVARKLPFRGKVRFSLNSTHFHENGGVSPCWGFFAKKGDFSRKSAIWRPLARSMPKPMEY